MISRLLLVCLAFSSLSLSSEAVYQAQPGDRLQIVVMGYPDYSILVEVRPDGYITYFGGELRAADKNIDDLAASIRERLVAYIPQPMVAVLPTRQGKQFFVLGEVTTPGPYPMPMGRPLSLMQAVGAAGGPRGSSADLSRVDLLRSVTGPVETYDLSAIPPVSVEVSAGDVIWIRRLPQIQVSGQVQNPGSFVVARAVSLAEALALAGGAVHDFADTTHLEIHRADGSTTSTDLLSEPATILRDGDMLHVPHAYQEQRIFVLGNVHSPGAYEVKAPISPLEAMALAGGAVEGAANLEKVWLIRQNGETSRLDLEAAYEGQANELLLLRPGDTLQIPRRRQINWSLILSLLSIVSVTVNLIQK